MSRTHVHCTTALNSKVGKRASVAVMLEIDVTSLRSEELEVFVAPNGVALVRNVPRHCIVDLLPRTSKASKELTRLRALFGW